MSDFEARTELAGYYSRVAGYYARGWGPVLRPFGVDLVESMRLDEAQVILDIGGGTGSLVPIVRKCAPGALVVEADVSEGMLRVARSDWPDVPVALMDAQRLGLLRSCVDAVIFAFVLFHIPDPRRALSEAKRVLRPGGCLALATWHVDGIPGSEVWAQELDACGAGLDPMPAVVMQHELMDDEAKVAGLLKEAGLAPRYARTMRAERGWTVEELVDTRLHCGGHGRRLRTLATEQREDCLERIRARLMGLRAGDLVQEMEVVLAVGEKPK